MSSGKTRNFEIIKGFQAWCNEPRKIATASAVHDGRGAEHAAPDGAGCPCLGLDRGLGVDKVKLMKPKLLIRCLLPLVLLAIAVSNVRADFLDNWTTNQVTTNSFGFHHIVYGNGIYVTVGEFGDSGGFYTSGDGVNWKLQYSEPNSWGVTLNYAGGRLMGVGRGSRVSDISLDGTNWTTIFLYNNGAPYYFGPVAITFGNGLYVIAGSTTDSSGVIYTGSVITSPDGVTWTPASFYPNAGGQLASVVYSPDADIFVALGNNDGYEYVYYDDGDSWYQSNIPGGNKIYYGNHLFIVPLNNHTNLLSADGINWTAKLTGLTNMLGKVTYGHGIFMAECGVSFATSADGTNWFNYAKPLPNSNTSGYDDSLATDGSHLVAVGAVGYPYANSFVYTSGPLVGVGMTNNPPPNVAISGLVGRKYQIQSSDALDAGNIWGTSAMFQLTNTPMAWTDNTATNSARFYRGVLLP